MERREEHIANSNGVIYLVDVRKRKKKKKKKNQMSITRKTRWHGCNKQIWEISIGEIRVRIKKKNTFANIDARVSYLRIICARIYAYEWQYHVGTSFGISRRKGGKTRTYRFLPSGPAHRAGRQPRSPHLLPTERMSYLLRPYLSGRDAHFVVVSDLYRVDDLIIFGPEALHKLLVLSIFAQEPLNVPCAEGQIKKQNN